MLYTGQEASTLVLAERQHLQGDARHGPRLTARQALLQVSNAQYTCVRIHTYTQLRGYAQIIN